MKEILNRLNNEIKELAGRLESASMFQKPVIAEEMLNKQLRFNELVVKVICGDD
jgi:hypothetical protein